MRYILTPDEFLQSFRNELGPLEESRLPGLIQVNRRFYRKETEDEVELQVTSYYQSEQIHEVGIWPDKFGWIEPEIQDIIEPMKVWFTTKEFLLESARKMGYHKALEDAKLS